MRPEHPLPDGVPGVVGGDEALADEPGADAGGGDGDGADAEDEGEGDLFGAAEGHGADDQERNDQDLRRVSWVAF